MESHILFMGANGSGKTTQGRALAGMMDRQYVDMSRIIKLGFGFDAQFLVEASSFVAQGELVPDNLLIPQVQRYFQSLRNGEFVVMSGLYRDPGQGPWTTEIISRCLGRTQLTVVDLILDPEDAIVRCKKRAEQDAARGVDPRADDLDEVTIRRRLELHERSKQPVLKYLVDELGAKVCEARCCDRRQDTMLNILRSLGLRPSALSFIPEGL